MEDNQLKAQAQKSSPHIKIAAGLWALGMMTIVAATITWIVLAVFAHDYFGYSKQVRDAAEAGSGVLGNLGTTEAVKAWVLPLQVLGLATFLFGFGFAFANILTNVRLRGNTMAAVLPAMKARKGG